MAASGGRILEALARVADQAYHGVTVTSTLIMFACVSWKGGTVGRLTVFLTGATGVIGSRVVGHDVVINLATHIPPSRRAFFPAWLGAGVGVPRVLHFVGIARRRRRGRCGGARCTRGDLQRLR